MTDRQQQAVRRDEREAKRMHRQWISDLRDVLGTPAGRRLFVRLDVETGMHEPAYRCVFDAPDQLVRWLWGEGLKYAPREMATLIQERAAAMKPDPQEDEDD